MKQLNEIVHNSSKEERDILLEYQNIDVTKLETLKVLGVPIDNVTADEAVAKLFRVLEKKEAMHHVLFLDPIKLMRMRPKKALHRITEKAGTILVEGAGIGWMSSGRLKERVTPVAIMMDLIRLAELKEFTIFIFGSKDENVERVFFNLTRHFPKVRIVGRQAGHLDRQREMRVKEAIRKTGPDIIFVANDFPEQEVWIENNTGFFGKAVVIGVGGALDMLSGADKKSPEYFKSRGLTWLWRIITRPYRIQRFWETFYFILLGIRERLRKKS
ncbi:glycosyl transferase [Leptospira kobayashii]|uniref:Glycosyl transferase n=1 Tax=Leptospira kobayashii TaxID=1917830 RepID=A0ABN6K9X4_9LEPT|nr:WecB/TagA/CpsF family glycosyltransferase [Leptospira kobayashii]BDA77576.1 glycosyl transferase [Leptospira kobayashii]